MNMIFAEIGMVVIVATGFALLARLLRQPPLFGYILAGITLGPIGAGIIHEPELLEAMRQIGVALLLFLVGLELDWNKAKHQLKAAAGLGIIQIGGSFLIGMAIAFAGELDLLTGVYIGLALAFSSTVIIVKLLSEARDLNSLHGRLSVSILLIQDIVAILALILLGGISGASALPIAEQVVVLTLKAFALFVVVWFMAQHILPPLFAKIAKSTELLFLASVAWCFIFAMAMAYFDFTLEAGAFLAGVSLASLPYTLDILSRLRSLRDFFVILLFVSLGTSLVLPQGTYLYLTLSLVLVTLAIRPLITFITLSLYGYRNRTSFLAALTQGQLSEFSLIIVAIGLASHQIAPEISSAVTFTMVVSVLANTFFFTHRNGLFRLLRPILKVAERNRKHHEHLTEEMESRLSDHVIIFGYHRMGYHILKKLSRKDHKILVVDFNPDIIRKLRAQGIDCVYGDVEDDEIFSHIRINKASLIVSTIPHLEENDFLIEQAKKHGRKAKLIVTSHSLDEALHYYKKGADYVILPHLLGGEFVADLIVRYQKGSLTTFIKQQEEELKLLKAKSHSLYFD